MNTKSSIWLVAGFFSLFVSPFAEAKTLFYQPRLADIELTQDQWDKQLKQAHEAGFDEIVIQWMQYGDVSFYDTAILKRLKNSALKDKFSFWFGLYMPDNYYSIMERRDTNSSDYFQTILEQSASLLAILEVYQIQSVFRTAGWYLPPELTSYYLENHLSKDVIPSILSFNQKQQVPLAVSYFVGVNKNITRSIVDANFLADSRLNVFFQLSNGLRDKPDFGDELKNLNCNVALVYESFIETASNQFYPTNTDFNHTSCHSQSVFSLRYLPFSTLER